MTRLRGPRWPCTRPAGSQVGLVDTRRAGRTVRGDSPVSLASAEGADLDQQSRVFPVPPAPVSVSRRISRSRWQRSPTVSRAPQSSIGCTGNAGADAGGALGGPCARRHACLDQCGPIRGVESQGVGQQADRIRPGMASPPAFQGGYRIGAEPRAFRERFLRKPAASRSRRRRSPNSVPDRLATAPSSPSRNVSAAAEPRLSSSKAAAG